MASCTGGWVWVGHTGPQRLRIRPQSAHPPKPHTPTALPLPPSGLTSPSPHPTCRLDKPLAAATRCCMCMCMRHVHASCACVMCMCHVHVYVYVHVHASCACACACVMCMCMSHVHASCWTCLWRAAWHPGRPRLPPNGQWLCQSPSCCPCCCLKRSLRLPPVATQPQHRAIERKGFGATTEQSFTLHIRYAHAYIPQQKKTLTDNNANKQQATTPTSNKHKTRQSTQAHNSLQQHTTASLTYQH